MSWMDKLKRRFARSEEGSDLPPARPPGEWTVSGISFDTSGWQLTERSASRMAWTAPCATLVLTSEPGDHPGPAALVEIRNAQRANARANDEDIVLVDVVHMRCGQALQVVYKRSAGRGFRYRGLTELQQGGALFRIQSEIDEGHTTGIREAMVTAALASCDELKLNPAKPDGSRTLVGYFHDPYDAAFDEGALNSVTDDERLDVIVPQHPLSRTRVLLRSIAESVMLSESGSTISLLDAPVGGDVLSTPRRQLPWSVVRSLYAAADRHDLVEQSLEEELTQSGDLPSLQRATSLMQLGIFRHIRDRPGDALPVLARAEALFTQLQGESAPSTATARAHHACALVKMGRHSQALPLFITAIKVLEKSRSDDATYTLALANAAQLLAERGDTDRANEYVRRAQQLMR